MVDRFVSYGGELGECGARSFSISGEGDAAVERKGSGGGDGCRSHLPVARRSERRRLAMAAPCGTARVRESTCASACLCLGVCGSVVARAGSGGEPTRQPEWRAR
jgi:hypothetical protein